MYAFMHVCMHICMHVCIYIYTYTYTYTGTRKTRNLDVEIQMRTQIQMQKQICTSILWGMGLGQGTNLEQPTSWAPLSDLILKRKRTLSPTPLREFQGGRYLRTKQ